MSFFEQKWTVLCKKWPIFYTKEAIEADNLSRFKEFYDILLKKNTPEESSEDMYANKIGRYLGYKYPQGDCDELVQRYIKKIYWAWA